MRNAAILLVLISNSVLADGITIGSKGINSKATGLDGDGIEIGQIEPGRSGKPNYGVPPEPSASNTNPRQVYYRTLVANDQEAVDEHATLVAGVMIGDATVGGGLFEGVATKAYLHSAAIGSVDSEEFDPDVDVVFALTADRLARISGPDPIDPNHIRRMRAINISAYRPLSGIPGDNNDGNSHMTLFVDWSARQHDVLYVAGWGNNDSAPKRTPSDNFNGMVVAASERVDPDNNDDIYRRFGTINAVQGQPADFPRNAISLLAPGQPVAILGHGDTPQQRDGTSAAAPHVTATAALLQQYAKPKVDAGTDPRWGTNSQRHEVMKAVMMNSADKLMSVHGSTRDVLDINGNNWTQSGATSPSAPTDPYIGTGHLNARRSLQQYQSGEYNPGIVPSIAWDYQSVGDRIEYLLEGGGGYIAATLAWDRRIVKSTSGNYMDGDQFDTGAPEDRLNNLDLYLMPANSNDFADAITKSISEVQNVEHIFFDVPSGGPYKLVVHNNPIGGIGDSQNYALAWWFGSGSTAPGDFNGDGNVNAADYVVWRKTDGSQAGYDEWRANFGNTSGSGGSASAPEPTSLTLLAIGVVLLPRLRRATFA